MESIKKIAGMLHEEMYDFETGNYVSMSDDEKIKFNALFDALNAFFEK